MVRQVSISSTFYTHLLRQYFYAKIFQSQNATREKLCEALSYKKISSKGLMKLTTDVIVFLHKAEMEAITIAE